MTYKEPIHDVAQLAHVEMYSPDVDATVGFFRDLLGMSVTAREGNSVDHTLFIGHVRDIHHDEDVAPLLFWSGQFQRLMDHA